MKHYKNVCETIMLLAHRTSNTCGFHAVSFKAIYSIDAEKEFCRSGECSRVLGGISCLVPRVLQKIREPRSAEHPIGLRKDLKDAIPLCDIEVDIVVASSCGVYHEFNRTCSSCSLRGVPLSPCFSSVQFPF